MWVSRVECSNASTWILLLVMNAVYIIDALNCYMCPRTDGRTEQEANIECLALGWELSCAEDEDRCFSRFYPDSMEVEKGCARSLACVETTSCCQTSYCNADAQTSKTGYGRPCSDATDCIQGGDEMVCQREVMTSPIKECLCAADSYKRGSTCKKKSFPNEPCLETRHCRDVNSTCIRRRCSCDPGMFANVTKCDYQTRLGEVCQISRECLGDNTACLGSTCMCDLGYVFSNVTDTCSGSMGYHGRSWTAVVILLMPIAITRVAVKLTYDE